MSDHTAPIVLSAIMYVVCIVGMVDLAINGVASTPGITMIYLGAIAISMIAATAVLATVAHDRSVAKHYRPRA